MTSPAYQISIPHPCTQSWEQMTPSGNGRHCMACDKVVTDFTGMSDRQVQDFFLEHQGKAVCGRFRKVQLDQIRIQVPSYILSKPIPLWKKFLVVLLICFGSSLFPFNVTFGNSFNTSIPAVHSLSPQDDTIVKPREKKRKKKRKIRYAGLEKLSRSIDVTLDIVLGGLGIDPVPEYIPPMTGAIVKSASSAALMVPPMPPKKKTPIKENPFSKAEFLVPAGWRKRKKR